MIHFGNDNPEVCVVGRCNFDTGMGSITYAFCELLSRSFATCVLPTEPELRDSSSVKLPNGRIVPVYKERDAIKASVFADVLWNGVHDLNYMLVPKSGLRIAYPCLDSDEVPVRWAEILNLSFDIAAVASPHLEQVLLRSGVEIPIAVVPLAVDLDTLLTRSPRKPSLAFRIGSVASFHRRKGTETLLEAFTLAFGDDPTVELFLHTNLVFPEALDNLQRRVGSAKLNNVRISTEPMASRAKNDLISTFDLFANLSLGEGFSIGAREALALGTPVVLSDVGGHAHLRNHSGVFLVAPTRTVPGRYPEIDNMIAGHQQAVTAADAATALRRAYDWAQTDERQHTNIDRRTLASSFSFRELSAGYAELIKPELAAARSNNPASKFLRIGDEAKVVARRRTAKAGPWKNANRVVVQAHDGGFFSLFNCYFSNMTWNLRDDRIHSTLPDWSVERFLARRAGQPPMSFCYGRVEDGNIWTKLFEPLFGLSDEEMNQESRLYDNATMPNNIVNADREPQLTYIHAYKLYHSARFRQIRVQYNNVFRKYIRLKPHLQNKIDSFVLENFTRKQMFSAHVRHPSHTIEQPEKTIAYADAYIRRIFDIAEQRGFSRDDPDWGVFLATDQERVILRFKEVFGDRVCFFNDMRRTTESEDAAFESLPAEERNQEGHQLQHLVASNTDNWSTSMAEEVICDAYVMAKCNILLHVVSNVSTAVSYMNPGLEMIYCPGSA